MRLQPWPLKLAVIMLTGLAGAFVPAGAVMADAIVLQDSTQPSASANTPVDLTLAAQAIASDDMAAGDKILLTPGAVKQIQLGAAQETTPPMAARTDPDLAADIRNTVKENLRPLHDQVIDSGALEAWNALKADMGLSHSKDEAETPGTARPKMSGQWEASNATTEQEHGSRPRTAEQTAMDREQADQMLRNLIDEIKPWAFTLLGLYLTGYLIKTGYDYTQRRSMRRRERKAAQVKRRLARKARSTQPDE